MHWIDWCITLIPFSFILAMALYTKRYVRGVVDYLAAGRVAGRYVISVGDLTSSLSVITLVALVEAKYKTGYALGFWENIMAPIYVVIALTGFCSYRYRETRSLSIGQFLEMRYSRPFRIFAATLRTVAEMITNAIGPAVAANFFIYFLGLPHRVMIPMPFGWEPLNLPCFVIVVAAILCLAMVVIWPGGRISLLITDCFQGLMCYPIFVILVLYIVMKFSWGNDIAPVMLDRVPGESFLNPFDVDQLRDFNIFALVVTIMAAILNKASWYGNDTTSAGRTPHEQKMAGVLGSWKTGFAFMLQLLLAVMLIAVMNHKNFAEEAHEIRLGLIGKVVQEAVADPGLRKDISRDIASMPVQVHEIGRDAPLSQNENLDTKYLDAVYKTMTESEHRQETGKTNLEFQKIRSLYGQMMLPMTLREIMPVGLIGIFALLMLLLLISTDDSRIFNASGTIVQDIILPFLKKPPTPKQHILLLRLTALAVAVFFFVVACFFTQLDYINMFVTIMCAVWLGGAGPVMIFGLYSRFGNTAGAWCSIFFGCGFSVFGLILQRTWAAHVYPALLKLDWVDPLDYFLHTVSAPFSPYIEWSMDPIKFPVNSFEIYFISMCLSILAYIAGSLVTYRKPFNLDRMLHRGVYSDNPDETPRKEKWNIRNVFSKLIGITPEYSRGDRIIAWSVFIYVFIYKIFFSFIVVLVWNMVSPWPERWWSYYFYTISIAVAGVVGVASTVWFLWGGIADTIALFRDLSKRKDNPLDNGMVEGHLSLADKAELEARHLNTGDSE
ncbi:MAG TPA: sodium:panthothenate symporter [Lentisphaeria bacterium]|nr:sodium:panthothenate symporter [Lentisphaeria bacterium]HCG49146.1 sodium:panthothenate symporter [Lentisphaeria bacterium]